jgi:hypothetical protein
MISCQSHALNMLRTTSEYRRILLLLGFLMLSVLIGGCSAQQMFGGPSRKKAEVAIVRGWGVTLHTVNGTSVGKDSAGVLILPGPNRFEVSINASNYFDGGSDGQTYLLLVNAQAGKEYAITTKRGAGQVCAYPLNESTGDPMFDQSAGCITQK